MDLNDIFLRHFTIFEEITNVKEQRGPDALTAEQLEDIDRLYYEAIKEEITDDTYVNDDYGSAESQLYIILRDRVQDAFSAAAEIEDGTDITAFIQNDMLNYLNARGIDPLQEENTNGQSY